MRIFKGIIMSMYSSKLTILRHFLKTLSMIHMPLYKPIASAGSKGVNPGGDRGDVSPPCFDMGGITCLLSPPPCFDPQICCFLAWKINNIL